MNNLIIPLGARCTEVHDESLYTGYAASKSEPKTAQEVSEIVKQCRARGEQITVSGSLTGLNGAAAPTGCHSMSTKKLKDMVYNRDNHTVLVGSGTTCREIEQFVLQQSNKTREFGVAPTEKTATIGGALSFGSTGLRSFRHGPVSSFVEEIEYCDAYGELKILSSDSLFQFIGSEGMLGVITRVTLHTIHRKPVVWGLMFFFPQESIATTFIDKIADSANLETLEFIDRACFELCEQYKPEMSALARIPVMPEGQVCGVLLELHAETEEDAESAAQTLMEEAESFLSDPDLAWAMVGDEVETLRAFRHAIAECINVEIAKQHEKDARIKKMLIDISWKQTNRNTIVEFYRKVLQTSGLRAFLYGHLGTFSLYAEIIPNSYEEYLKGLDLMDFCYKKAINSGNIAFAEFGIGKLNKHLFCQNAKVDELNQKLRIKRKYDPEGVFNPGNMIENVGR